MSSNRFPAHPALTADERRVWDNHIAESEQNFAPRVFCRYCQGELPDNPRLCPWCGAQIKDGRDYLRPDLADLARMGVGASG